MELQKLYSDQLIELQEQRKKERETLDRCEVALSDFIDSKKFISDLEEGLKRLELAWGKANPKMRKALLQVVIDSLIFQKMQVQIFYRQINLRSGGGKSDENITQCKSVVVDMSTKRNSKKLEKEILALASTSANVSSSDVLIGLFKTHPITRRL